MARSSDDPVVRSCRQQIAGLDRRILEALNLRIDLVKRLKVHKEAQGLAFHDPAQEERLLDQLCRANGGPLSEEGVRTIFRLILEWGKRD
ncbi:MAG: chorismate mutase [Holophaga sp.]